MFVTCLRLFHTYTEIPLQSILNTLVFLFCNFPLLKSKVKELTMSYQSSKSSFTQNSTDADAVRISTVLCSPFR